MDGLPTLGETVSRVLSALPIYLLLVLMILTVVWMIKISQAEKRAITLHRRLLYPLSPEGVTDSSEGAERDRRKYRDSLAVMAKSKS